MIQVCEDSWKGKSQLPGRWAFPKPLLAGHSLPGPPASPRLTSTSCPATLAKQSPSAQRGPAPRRRLAIFAPAAPRPRLQVGGAGRAGPGAVGPVTAPPAGARGGYLVAGREWASFIHHRCLVPVLPAQGRPPPIPWGIRVWIPLP